MARDRAFGNVVDRRLVKVAAVRDHTVRATVQGNVLRPGEEYFCRFATRSGSSAVGRFCTARPADSMETLRTGFFSCQDCQAGWYTAHAAPAQEGPRPRRRPRRLDLRAPLLQRPDRVRAARQHRCNGDSDVQTLPEYRAKYALYRSDPNLQAMHHSAAYASVWDDHEIEDDGGGMLRGDETPNRRVPFPERRRAGMLAFDEWMPRPRPPGDRIYTGLPLVANAETATGASAARCWSTRVPPARRTSRSSPATSTTSSPARCTRTDASRPTCAVAATGSSRSRPASST